MVVCKYFLQGACRFGTYCRYEHQIPSNYNYMNNNETKSTSILRQTTEQESGESTINFKDMTTIGKTIATDMLNAKRGGQWLLSSYSLLKGKPVFPGFEDHSPEEVRWGYYEARNNGKLEQYKQQWQAMMHTVLMKIQAVQNLTPEVMVVIREMLAAPTNDGLISNNNGVFPNQQNIFATNPSSNVFGQSTNVFAGSNALATNQNQNIFANTNSSTVTNQGQSIFSDNTRNFTGFGSPPSTNAFGGQPTSGGIFGGAIVSNQASFGGPSQPVNNLFQSSTVPPNFTNQNVFNTIPQAQAQLPEYNMLAGNANSMQSTTPQNYSASIFGNSAANAAPSSHFSTNSNSVSIDKSLYSEPEDLTDQEKMWFESDTSDLLNIPDKPPTYDMCFKK